MAAAPWLQRLWGLVTPWQTNAEEAAGVTGTWGSGDYVGEGSGLQLDTWTNPVSATERRFQGIFDDANTQAAADIDPLRAQIAGLYDENGQITFPGFTEWLAAHPELAPDQTDPYAAGGAGTKAEGIADLIAQLSPDSPEAQAYAASIAGFEDILDADGNVIQSAWEQRQEFVQGLTDIVGAGEGAGMSAEDMALQQKTIRRNTAAMEERAARMIADTKSDTGSVGRMFMQADESLNQIADVEIKQQMQLASDNRNLAFQQYQVAVQGLDQQLQSGQISTTGYVDTKRMALGDAMSGYFKEVDQIFQQNEQKFSQSMEMYQADYNAMVASVQATIAAIQMDLGLIMAEYEAASQIAAQQLGIIFGSAEYDSYMAEQGFGFDEIIQLVTAAADIISAIGDVIPF